MNVKIGDRVEFFSHEGRFHPLSLVEEICSMSKYPQLNLAVWDALKQRWFATVNTSHASNDTAKSFWRFPYEADNAG